MESGIPLRTLLSWAAGSVLTMAGIAGYMSYQGKHKEQPVDIKLLAYESAMKKHEAALELLRKEPFSTQSEAFGRLDSLNEVEANSVLRKQEKSWTLNASGDCAKLHVFANQVAANDPIEDYYVWLPLETSKSPDGKYSQHMFAVYDGHSRHYCAEQLHARLGAKVDQALSIVKELALADNDGLELNSSLAQTIVRLKDEPGNDDCQTTLALKAAIIDMDKELVHDSVTEYKKDPTPENREKYIAPARSGSCGVIGILDTKNNEVVVGNVGDSRAIKIHKGSDGFWNGVPMSEDHDLKKNHKEVMRMLKEHPGEDQVISACRVLGNLAVPRAFGNGRLKWTLDLKNEIFPSTYEFQISFDKANYLSPPYLTANPDIQKFKLKEEDKFLVFVSDGITCWMDNDSIAEVLGQWYDSRNDKCTIIPNMAMVAKEENPSSAVIRATLSRDYFKRYNDKLYHERLSIPLEYSRRCRDDMTALVVMLNPDELPANKQV